MTQFSLTMNDGTILTWMAPDPEHPVAGDYEEFNWLLTPEDV